MMATMNSLSTTKWGTVTPEASAERVFDNFAIISCQEKDFVCIVKLKSCKLGCQSYRIAVNSCIRGLKYINKIFRVNPGVQLQKITVSHKATTSSSQADRQTSTSTPESSDQSFAFLTRCSNTLLITSYHVYLQFPSKIHKISNIRLLAMKRFGGSRVLIYPAKARVRLLERIFIIHRTRRREGFDEYWYCSPLDSMEDWKMKDSLVTFTLGSFRVDFLLGIYTSILPPTSSMGWSQRQHVTAWTWLLVQKKVW